MRYRWLSLAALLATAVVTFAQQPPGVQLKQPTGAQQPQFVQQPTLDPVNNKLDAILLAWEREMSGMKTLKADVVRTDTDKVFMIKKVFKGWAKYMAPNKASLSLQNQDPKNPQDFEKMVCNGQTAYKWEPKAKEIHQYDLPKPKQGQINDDNFVSMLVGLKAVEAKQRYQLEHFPPFDDQHYHFILVLPRDSVDKAEFARARISILKRTNLPAEIRYEQPNGNEQVWWFPQMVKNDPIDAKEFLPPNNIPGWPLKRVAIPEGPRVIRPQDGK